MINHKELSTITRPLAIIAVGALALAGCAAAESEPAPVETVYVEAEPEPATDYTDDAEFDQLVFDLTWATLDQEGKENICWGVGFLGKEWTIENWDEETSGISGETVYPMIMEACEDEGLL